jgi:hypothetical protein
MIVRLRSQYAKVHKGCAWVGRALALFFAFTRQARGVFVGAFAEAAF